MNRREAFRRVLGVPAVVAGVTVAADLSPVLVLEANAVSADMVISGDGEGRSFMFTLLRKPWPAVGQRIVFEHKGLRLAGIVTDFSTESIHGSDRIKYHVRGTVQAFDAKAVYDR